MEDISQELNTLVNDFFAKHKTLDEEITLVDPGNDEWNLKEIIGHLIDSACNNHQRFVRLQIVDELVFPDYGQDNSRWIRIAGYNEIKFSDILLLWKQYNVLLGNIIKKVDSSRLDNCWIANGKRVTLKFLMTDYVRHIKDHIRQFEETLKTIA
jgi:hypothetical protein